MKTRPFDIIYLDMDGVLCDFVGSAMDLLHGTGTFTWRDVTSHDKWKELRGDPDAFDTLIKAQGERFWADLTPTEEAFALLSAAKDQAYYVGILTRPMSCCLHACIKGKTEWLYKYGFLDKVDSVIFSPEKHLQAHNRRTLLIDDTPPMCDAFAQAGGSTYMMPRPWNASVNHHVGTPFVF